MKLFSVQYKPYDYSKDTQAVAVAANSIVRAVDYVEKKSIGRYKSGRVISASEINDNIRIAK